MQINQQGTGSLLGTATGQALSQAGDVVSPRAQRSDAGEVQPAARPARSSRRSALGILSREIRAVLAASFRIGIRSGLPAYSATTEPQSAGNVANEALRAGKAIAGRAPLDAGRSLDDLRRKVESAAADVREIVGDDDDGLEDAMSMIGAGLDDQEEDAARNVVSSAAVLSYESRLKQRSMIRIRTQEGDVVRFDLRRVEQMSASDVAVTDGNVSLSSTEIELSSQTRMILRVDGDLNEAEFAAIRNVFVQAKSISEEFFGGDLAKAFDMAAGIEFDTEQLSKVRMRFREQLDTALSFTSLRTVMPEAVALPDPGPAPAIGVKPEPIPTIQPVDEAAPDVVVAQASDGQDDAGSASEPGSVNAAAEAPVEEDAIGGFLKLLGDFLRSVNEGFEPEPGSSRYFYSQSFKLGILKAVLEFTAPDNSRKAAENAAAFIDPVAVAEESA